jgi:diguanylate cyclase (GGDEF)-like protein
MAGKKNSILIMEDSLLCQKQLIGILGDTYHVVAARTAHEALNTLTEMIPDLILLDIMMPDIDGRDIIKILKNSKEIQHVPVIFITSLSDADTERSGLALGAADFIAKPIDPAIVKLRVQNQMQMVNQLNIVRQMGTIDELTGLPNRRSFDERLALFWRKAKRDKKTISLLMVDIDHFKAYNDTYGHLQGDEALKALAVILNGALKRAGDYAVRWGGEEFAVVLPDTGHEGAMKVAEEVRAQAENAEIAGMDGTITKITVSVGVCTHVPMQKCGTDILVDNADKALYRAKVEGRNRVCAHHNEEA